LATRSAVLIRSAILTSTPSALNSVPAAICFSISAPAGLANCAADASALLPARLAMAEPSITDSEVALDKAACRQFSWLFASKAAGT